MLKGRTINYLAEGLGKSGKKTQPLLAWEKNSTIWKKKNSAGWLGKKTQHEFSAQGPPRSLMVRP